MRINFNAALVQLSLVGLYAFSFLVLVLILASIPTAATSELLVNPDFEDGLAGWGKSPGTTLYSVITAPVYAGLQAAAVGSASNSAKAIMQRISGIVPGQVYTFSGFAYRNDPNLNVVRLRLAWYTSTDCSGSQSSINDSNLLNSDLMSFVFLTTGPVAAPSGTQCAEVRAQVVPKNATPTTAYFDTLSFTTDSLITPTATLSAATTTPTPTATITSTLRPPTLTPTPAITSSPTLTTGPIINEVAWSGTAASGNDEWIELYNREPEDITLDGWSIANVSGSININLSGIISANSYYLLERTDDNVVLDISADLTYKGGLADAGDTLYLRNGSVIVDSVNLDGGGWPSGTANPDRASMERIDPGSPGVDSNWASNDLIHRNGQDANGSPINGTPGQPNSTTYDPLLRSHRRLV